MLVYVHTEGNECEERRKAPAAPRADPGRLYYCERCLTSQPVLHDPASSVAEEGPTKTFDIVCLACGFIIATFKREE